MNLINIHVYASTMVNQSRILRGTKALASSALFERIELVGTHGKGLPLVECLDQVRSIIRIPTLLTRRFKGNLFKFLGLIEWNLRVAIRYGTAGPLCISCHSLITLPVCGYLKWKTKGKLIYETHELETETIPNAGIRRLFSKAVEKILIKYSDQVMVVTDHIADWYASTYRISRPVVVRNIPEQQNELTTEDREMLRRRCRIPKDEIVFLYQGVFGEGRCIRQLLRIFSSIGITRHMVFIGFGPLRDQIEHAARQSQNIHLLPAVPPMDLLKWTCGADVGIVGVENRCLSYYYSLPNKLFEYLQAGIPVITNDLPEIRRIVEMGPSGWVASFDLEAWKALVLSLTREDIARKRAAVPGTSSLYTWGEESKRLVTTYKQLLAENFKIADGQEIGKQCTIRTEAKLGTSITPPA